MIAPKNRTGLECRHHLPSPSPLEAVLGTACSGDLGSTAPGGVVCTTAAECRAGSGSERQLSRRALAVHRFLLVAWLVATDALALDCAFRVAYSVRFEMQLTVAPEVVAPRGTYDILTALLIPLWLAVFALFDLYEPRSKLGGSVESSRTLNACTVATMLVIVATFLVPNFVISRVWLVSVWLASFCLVAVNRFVARRLVYSVRRRGYLLTPAVIVGTNQEAVSLAAFLADRQSSGVRTVGLIHAGNGDPRSVGNQPVLGSIAEIGSIVRNHGIEDVIVAITGIGRDELLRLCEDLDALPVRLRLSSGLYELLTTRVTVQTLGTVPLMSLQKNRLDRAEVITKTLLDASLAVMALFFLWPLMLFIAAWIKLDSPGPSIHRRRVLGASGRQFDAFKFRTMYTNGDALLASHPDAVEALHNDHKLRDDPRVTRIGRWLRKYSLDEVPQLLNVVRGEMSLVGPRMIAPDEAAKYGRQRMNLLSVKPGITGLWQVSGRSDLTYDERVRIDMYYVRNYSVWLDLQILFIQTLPAVLKGRGAY